MWLYLHSLVSTLTSVTVQLQLIKDQCKIQHFCKLKSADDCAKQWREHDHKRLAKLWSCCCSANHSCELCIAVQIWWEQVLHNKHDRKRLSRLWRRSQNTSIYPGSEKAKTFRVHPKTFWIKRVNLDIFDFATNVRKTRQFHVFLANVCKNRQ